MNFYDFVRSKVMDAWCFRNIVIVSDKLTLDGATALRAGLELFDMRVTLVMPSTRERLYEVLGGEVPQGGHVILCTHGDEGRIYFGVYPETWVGPDEIKAHVCLRDKLVMSLGCGAGGPAIASAFLSAGCRAFIGAERFTRTDAVLLLPLVFYSHLVLNGPHSSQAPARYNEREAFEAARRLVPQGGVFEFYSSAPVAEHLSVPGG